ncbi:hypothetical protein BDY21DRAFT_368067 [Lineolata rhizophorae]|uniref:Uncharacterized protein n=1 Tax=Lineolata rhizophorae TaxID=578093 RepID=A0A6A6PD66_9PEZI|nr:hypothetical protein BDY21DRAFT_368067 [Lineolata rhizophorae]
MKIAVFNMFAVLALEIPTTIFWLAGFASMADLAADSSSCAKGLNYKCEDLLSKGASWDYGDDDDDIIDSVGNIWVLSSICLAVFVVSMRRAGKANDLEQPNSTSGNGRSKDDETLQAAQAQPQQPSQHWA